MPRNPNKPRTPEQQIEIAEYVKTHSVKDTMRRYRLKENELRAIMDSHDVESCEERKEGIFYVFDYGCWMTGGRFNGRGKILS